MIVGATLTVVGVAALLYAEAAERPALRWLGKPLASLGFIVAALGVPDVRLPHGTAWLLLGALVLSAAGDVLLVPDGTRWFLAGMGAFALAHIGYAAWFVSAGVRPAVLAVTVLLMLVVGHLAWRWLAPHLHGGYRIPVRVYVLVISLMTATALAAGVQAAQTASLALGLPALGGVLFCISDVAVARQRFIRAEFGNRAWGLPLYYLGQLLLASAVLAR